MIVAKCSKQSTYFISWEQIWLVIRRVCETGAYRISIMAKDLRVEVKNKGSFYLNVS